MPGPAVAAAAAGGGLLIPGWGEEGGEGAYRLLSSLLSFSPSPLPVAQVKGRGLPFHSRDWGGGGPSHKGVQYIRPTGEQGSISSDRRDTVPVCMGDEGRISFIVRLPE